MRVRTFIVFNLDGHDTEHEQTSKFVSQPGGKIETDARVGAPRLVASVEKPRCIGAHRGVYKHLSHLYRLFNFSIGD